MLPLFGSCLYVLLYLAAAWLYPGGSQFDKAAKGFSWLHNYWCNLLNEQAGNGEPNPARPVALTAMLVLCGTLALFWYLFPQYAGFKKSTRLLLRVSGIAAMAIGAFLFTPLHDVIINVATLFGMIALAGTFTGLYRLRWKKLFWMGLFNLVLVAANNALYYGNGLLYLPVVQKITFLYFLLWISLISGCLYRHIPAATAQT